LRRGAASQDGVRPRAKRLDMPSSNDESSALSLDARFVATIRCVLAIALAFILTLDRLTRARFSEVSDLLLGLYSWILFRFSFFALLINESTGVLIEIPLKYRNRSRATFERCYH
jgi:hypothetical protein